MKDLEWPSVSRFPYLPSNGDTIDGGLMLLEYYGHELRVALDKQPPSPLYESYINQMVGFFKEYLVACAFGEARHCVDKTVPPRNQWPSNIEWFRRHASGTASDRDPSALREWEEWPFDIDDAIEALEALFTEVRWVSGYGGPNWGFLMHLISQNPKSRWEKQLFIEHLIHATHCSGSPIQTTKLRFYHSGAAVYIVDWKRHFQDDCCIEKAFDITKMYSNVAETSCLLLPLGTHFYTITTPCNHLEGRAVNGSSRYKAQTEYTYQFREAHECSCGKVKFLSDKACNTLCEDCHKCVDTHERHCEKCPALYTHKHCQSCGKNYSFGRKVTCKKFCPFCGECHGWYDTCLSIREFNITAGEYKYGDYTSWLLGKTPGRMEKALQKRGYTIGNPDKLKERIKEHRKRYGRKNQMVRSFMSDGQCPCKKDTPA